MKMAKRIHPLPQTLPIYENFWSEYPDRGRVAMENGKVIDYYRIGGQEKSVLKETIDKLDKIVFGGK
jgi:hypothetical protein